MKILLTAFDPFGGETVNPAQEALKQIQAPAPDMELIKLVVPTVFGSSTQAVHEAMVLHQPDVVLCIGQAGGRTAITVEQIAINLMDAAIPDNQGNQPHDEPVFADGADGCMVFCITFIMNFPIPGADSSMSLIFRFRLPL